MSDAWSSFTNVLHYWALALLAPLLLAYLWKCDVLRVRSIAVLASLTACWCLREPILESISPLQTTLFASTPVRFFAGIFQHILPT